MQSEEMKVVQGKSITIRCETYGTELEVEWMKDGMPYEVQHKSKQLTSILISPAALNDSGRYTCIASNRGGVARASTQLHVLVAPVIPDGERIIQAKENGSITIDCSTPDARPAATYTWRKDGVLLEDKTEGTLTLTDLKSTDGGKVTCTAENEAGIANADFALEVHSRPRFKELVTEIKVIEGERARIECKAEGHPTPEIRQIVSLRIGEENATYTRRRFLWLKGGRNLNSMSNIILSPRGETLMILKSQRSDGGAYSCVAKNSAGESEASFTVSVLTPPHIDEPVDQNPKVIVGREVTFFCPVLGNPQPKIEWLHDGKPLQIGGRITLLEGKHLHITKAIAADDARYTCKATNEAGELQTQYEPRLIARPKFHDNGTYVYEVVENQKVTMECNVTTDTKPVIDWFRGGEPLYLSENILLSSDATKLTIQSATLSDGGSYQCKASNEAGSSEIDMSLKILVPPKIDKSNIIGNPLAIVDRPIYLECPVEGIPPPTIAWFQDDKPINYTKNGRFILAQANQTLGLEPVRRGDEAVYSCVATNKGGSVREDFHLEVLVPPVMDVNETQNQTRREGQSLILTCPIRATVEVEDAVQDVNWVKDGRPIDPNVTNANIKISRDGRTLTLNAVSRKDSGIISCVAINRAGESSAEFRLDVLCTNLVTAECRALEHDYLRKVHERRDISYARRRLYEEYKWHYELEDRRRRERQEQLTRMSTTRQPPAARIWKIADKYLAPPSIDETKANKDLHVVIGKPIELTCPAAGDPPPTIKWLKNGEEISENGIRVTDGGRTLIIDETKAEHAGEWQCVAENDAGSQSLHINLNLWTPPVVKVTSDGAVKKLDETVTLYCTASGNPPATLTWIKEGQPVIHSPEGIRISQKGARLDIPHLKKTDIGEYVCQASNDAGSATASILVDVLVPPEIKRNVEMEPRGLFGQSVTIRCDVTGKPPPKIKWILNGTELTGADPNVIISPDKMQLTISNITMDNKGVYSCQAENSAGADSLEYNIDIIQAPVIMNGGNRQVIEGELAKIDCQVTAYPPAQISWLRNGVRIDTGVQGVRYIVDGNMLSVLEARSSDSGIYVCEAVNEGGRAQQAYTLEILVSPKITNASAVNQSIPSGSSYTLNCGARGYPEPVITWTVDGVEISGNNSEYTIGLDGSLTIAAASGRLKAFECTAKNNAGVDTLEFNIQAISAPHATKDGERSVNASEGQPVEMTCGVEAENAEIKWTKASKASIK
ncbi:hypothetical protein WR25_18700 [Diploscapter pachys]|uniref:Ig-like domain-containing protein n=1 Tax=Diploscapter pachys TaxID=2018661 RepID=A0A2A2KFB5_9BILA|nr:hypothetical protein WR25_18700 [Diploscapter pachys]